MRKEEKKPVYMLCPRCELNYITKKDKLCPVCKAEMGLVDKAILIPDEEEVEKICPVCKINLLGDDEEVCFMCQKEHKDEEGEENNPEWHGFREDDELADPDIASPLPLDDVDEEEEEEDEFVSEDDEPDDFDYDVDPEDFEEDEEEEEDLEDDE